MYDIKLEILQKKDNRPSPVPLKKCIFTIYFVDHFQKSRTEERWKSSEIQLLDKKERKKSWPRKKGKILTFFSHILLVTENFMNQDNWERGSKKVLLFHIV